MTNYPPVEAISSIEEGIVVLTKCRDRARDWLLDQIDDDGKPVGSESKNAYYRLPWTFSELGETTAAARSMAWIEREALTDAGDLRVGTPRERFATSTATYPLTLIAHGAWQLQRYDVAEAIMRTLRGMRDPNTGGALWERPDSQVTGYQLAYPTAALGLTALLMGDDEVANDAFGWFTRLWDAQPDLPSVLYAAWGPDGLITKPVESLAWQSVLNFQTPRQSVFTPGLSAAFLSRYALARGDDRAKQIALDLLALHQHSTAEHFNYWDSTQICKFGLGSSAAYEIDPDGPHLQNVLFMADWYRKAQAADGSYSPSMFLNPNPAATDRLYKTAEHTVWIIYMLNALSRASTAK